MTVQKRIALIDPDTIFDADEIILGTDNSGQIISRKVGDGTTIYSELTELISKRVNITYYQYEDSISNTLISNLPIADLLIVGMYKNGFKQTLTTEINPPGLNEVFMDLENDLFIFSENFKQFDTINFDFYNTTDLPGEGGFTYTLTLSLS